MLGFVKVGWFDGGVNGFVRKLGTLCCGGDKDRGIARHGLSSA